MKILKPSIFIIIALIACTMIGRSQTADEILRLHEKAMGGMENWEKIKTMTMSGTLFQQGVEVSVSKTLVAGKAMKMSTTFGGVTNSYVFSINSGWIGFSELGSAKVDTVSDEYVHFFWPEVDMLTSQFLNYKTNGMKAIYEGTDSVENIPCYKISMTSKKGVEYTTYFDRSDYYLRRVEAIEKTDDGERELFIAYRDFKKNSGVVIPMSYKNPNTGTNFNKEIEYSTVSINAPVDENIFKAPFKDQDK